MSIFEISSEAYHADMVGDPGDPPSLSRSVIHQLLVASPAHAKAIHPRLADKPLPPEDAERFDIGTAAHAMLLEGQDPVVVCEFPDWRTKGAQQARAEAREEGRIPLLTKQYDRTMEMVQAVRKQLTGFSLDPHPLTGGTPELTATWREGDVHCRARFDWLHDDQRVIDDLKTTAGSANPAVWQKQAFSLGYDVQAAFYSRGLEKITGQRVLFRFLVVEVAPPFAVSAVTLAPDALALANAKVDWALERWAECLREDRWPAYPARLAFLDAPVYEEARFLEMKERAA